MKTRTSMKTMSGVLALCLLAVTFARVSAQEMYRLMSAQVVTATEQPAVLKLTANGPIAFQVVDEPADGSGQPHRLVARLYGVAPGDALAGGGVAGAPFSLALRGEGNDTIVTVSVASGAALGMRAASRANEVEVFAK